MPFEFGVFMGAKQFGSKKQTAKSCLILDTGKYRFMEFLSDISGQDIKDHNNDPIQAIENIRNWLNNYPSLRPLAGATAIIEKYKQYRLDRLSILLTLNLVEEDVQYADRIQIIEQWIPLNPL